MIGVFEEPEVVWGERERDREREEEREPERGTISNFGKGPPSWARLLPQDDDTCANIGRHRVRDNEVRLGKKWFKLGLDPVSFSLLPRWVSHSLKKRLDSVPLG